LKSWVNTHWALAVNSGTVIMEAYSKASPFTAKHPYVHDYNPLTHMRKNSSAAPPTSSAPLETSANAAYKAIKAPLSPQKRLAKSLPRSVYSDPLTGRVLDFSHPNTRNVLISSAAMSLAQRPVNFDKLPKILETQRYHKTRLRTEMYDPITGSKTDVQVSREPVESLDTRARQVRPLTLASSLQPAPDTSGIAGLGESIAASRRRKAESLAYVNPYNLSP